MKAIQQILGIVILAITINSQAQFSGGGEANPNLKTNKEALKRFQDNRFGMFIHWGPVTLRGTEIGWSRGKEVPNEDYDNLFKEFNPVLFNADAWVKTAKDAGMKYIVITARHHDGFSLWDSEFTDYDMKSTPYGKGVLKELSEACKSYGIDFGLYYSICDWKRDDYPVDRFSEDYKMYSEKEITDPRMKKKMDEYISFIKNQLKELIETYDPTLFWFDGEWEWAWTHEMGMDLYAYLRSLNDELLINNRVDKARSGMGEFSVDPKFAGDYGTPEQEIGKYDVENAWESCITIANQWAWKANDKLKPTKQCIQTLVQTVSGGGNLLLNVGPMADGRIEQRQVDRLKEVGDWLKIYGEAIYGTNGGPFLPTKSMVSTRKGNTIYIHLLENSLSNLELVLPKGYKIKKVSFLGSSETIDLKTKKGEINIPLPKKLPNEYVSVIALELNKSTDELNTIK